MCTSQAHTLYTQTQWPCWVAMTTAPCQQNMSATMWRLYSTEQERDRGVRLKAAWAVMGDLIQNKGCLIQTCTKNNRSTTMTLHFSQNALCQNMSSPDELIDIHELPGVLFRAKSKNWAFSSENLLCILLQDPSLSVFPGVVRVCNTSSGVPN